MKKVINITLGSVVFVIEQDAFDALAAYLEDIKQNLAATEDAKEVIDDIEGALAEKFIVRKRSEKLAVTTDDVSEVMAEMGSPAEFGEGDTSDTGEVHATKAHTQSQSGADSNKRLYRDADDTIIAGVASGIARYFDIDPVIVRLIFVIAVFFNGLGLLAYIILWLIVPVAKTQTEKYAMRGEPITLRDISERVKKNIQGAEEANVAAVENARSNTRQLLDTFFRALGRVVRVVIMIARYVVGIVFIIGGALGVAGLVSVYTIILLSDKVLFPSDVQIALETLQGSALGIVAMLSSFIMMTIPLTVLIIAGTSLLMKSNFFTVQKTVTLAVVWIVAVVVAGTTSALQAEQVMQQVGPVEGRFNDSSFQIQWEEGMIKGNDREVHFYRD